MKWHRFAWVVLAGMASRPFRLTNACMKAEPHVRVWLSCSPRKAGAVAGRPLAEPVRGAAVPARLVHTHISTRALNISPCFRPAAVSLALGSLLALCELTGLRSRFTLEFIQHELPMHQLGGIPVFTLLFSLGNLIRIPGWLFLAAAVLTLGKISGETAA